MVSPRRRSRRSRSDVCARDVSLRRARRAGEPRGSRQAAGRCRQARARRCLLQSRPALSRGPTISRRISRAPPNCFAAPRRPAMRKRNTPSPRSTRKAAACRRIRARRRGCWPPQRLRTTPMPKSNMPSRCSMAPARPRTRPPPPSYLQKAARKGSPIAQNRLANVLAHGRGCLPIRSGAVKWHLIAKAGGATDIALDDFVTSRNRKSAPPARKRRSPGSIRDQAFALLTGRTRAARHRVSGHARSALLNVMIKAANKAARTLKRDFGEVEHLQVR